MTQPTNMNIGDNNNLFATIEGTMKPSAEIQETPQNLSNASQQEITLRPLPMSDLHRDLQTFVLNEPPSTASTQLGKEPPLAI